LPSEGRKHKKEEEQQWLMFNFVFILLANDFSSLEEQNSAVVSALFLGLIVCMSAIDTDATCQGISPERR
jgi:hypothetical protein